MEENLTTGTEPGQDSTDQSAVDQPVTITVDDVTISQFSDDIWLQLRDLFFKAPADPLPMEVDLLEGQEAAPEGLTQQQESIGVQLVDYAYNRPFLTTPFEQYTVTEGLLLCLVFISFFSAIFSFFNHRR